MRIKALILLWAILVPGIVLGAETGADCHVDASDNVAGADVHPQLIVRKDSVKPHPLGPEDLVIVGKDTVPMVLPEKNYGRYDRGLYNYLYAPKGAWAFGVTASYGSLNTEDLRIMSVIENLDFQGKIYSIKPSVSYFFKHNQSLGLRIDYSRGEANLKSLNVDIEDDLSMALHDVDYDNENCKFALFYRNYVGLNRSKRFAIFNEVALDFGTGCSHFKRYYDKVLYDTKNKIFTANLNFSPGLNVFIQDYVAFNVSFGVFGLHVDREKQTTNGSDDGTRVSSGANFRFNIFNINFGLMVVI